MTKERKRRKSKFTDEQIRAIYTDTRPTRVICREFGISNAFVWQIKNSQVHADKTVGLVLGRAQGPVVWREFYLTLTHDQIKSAYVDTRTAREIADEYGVSYCLITMIKRDQTHSHITAGLVAHRRGKGRPSDLTPQQIRAIFLSAKTTRQITAEFNTSAAHVARIKSRRAHPGLTADLVAPFRKAGRGSRNV